MNFFFQNPKECTSSANEPLWHKFRNSRKMKNINPFSSLKKNVLSPADKFLLYKYCYIKNRFSFQRREKCTSPVYEFMSHKCTNNENKRSIQIRKCSNMPKNPVTSFTQCRNNRNIKKWIFTPSNIREFRSS